MQPIPLLQRILGAIPFRAANRSKQRTIRFLLPSCKAGAVIGRGGCNIEKIRKDTGALVELEGNRTWDHKVVFILEMNEEEMCSLLAISQLKLKQKIHGIEPLVLSSARVSGKEEKNVVQAFLRVYLASHADSSVFVDGNEPSFEDTLKHLGELASVKLLLPDRHVGALIGKGGSTITRLREESDVRIDVDNSLVIPGSGPDLRVVTLDGVLERVLKVKKLIYETLDEAYPGDSWHMRIEEPRRSGTNAASARRSAYSSRDHGNDSRGARNGRCVGQSKTNLSLVTMEEDSRLTPHQRGPRQHNPQHEFAPSNFNQDHPDTYKRQTYAHSGSKQTPLSGSEVIPVPKERVGAIIGKGGSTVKDIRQRSGCTVTIHDAAAGSSLRQVTLRGSKPARETARNLIRTLLDRKGPHYSIADI